MIGHAGIFDVRRVEIAGARPGYGQRYVGGVGPFSAVYSVTMLAVSGRPLSATTCRGEFKKSRRSFG